MASSRTASRTDLLLLRVKKLLALSTSSNVHEAAAAAAAAQALITRHQLEAVLAADDDVRGGGHDALDPITDGSEAPLEVARRFRRWKVALAHGLADKNGGVVWSAEHSDGTHLCFCGRRSDRLVVAALFEWLQVRIEWLSASAGAGRDRRWHEGFRVGAAEAIVDRLTAPRAADEVGTDDVVTRAALVKAEPLLAARAAAVDRFVDEHLRLGKGRGYRVDGRGFDKGRAAGLALPLPPAPAVTTSKQTTTKPATTKTTKPATTKTTKPAT